MRNEVVERLQELTDLTGVELEEVALRLTLSDTEPDDVAVCLKRAIWHLGAALEISEGTRRVWPRAGKRSRELEDARHRRIQLRAGRVPTAAPPT
jgi:hypothetical protein